MWCAVLCAGGCDSRPPPPPVDPDETIPTELIADPLAQLLPNRTTHLTADKNGTLYWVQEPTDELSPAQPSSAGAGSGAASADTQGGVVYSVVPGELPRFTGLTVDRILSAANVLARARGEPDAPPRDLKNRAAPVPSAAGSIQSLVATVDGDLLFYFSGGVGPRSRSCLGRFDVRGEGAVRIIADTEALGRAGGMGASLDVARGRLLAWKRQHFRLSLRNLDRAVMFAFDVRKLPLGRGTGSGAGQTDPTWFVPVLAAGVTIAEGEVAAPASTITPPEPGATGNAASARRALRLTSDDTEFVAMDGADVMILIDRFEGALFRVPADGRATPFASIVGLPRALSMPARTDGGDLLVFAGDGPVIDPLNSSRADPPMFDGEPPQYPAMVTLPNPDTLAARRDSGGRALRDRLTAIDRNHIRTTSSLAVYAMRLQQLVPIAKDAWAGYDPVSGQIIRLRYAR